MNEELGTKKNISFDTINLLKPAEIKAFLDQYRDITRRETGRTGWLFYSYVVAMIVTLVTAIVGLVLRAL